MPTAYRQIPLTRGAIALVDDDLYPILCRHLWFCDSGGYARRVGSQKDKEPSVIKMHREVLTLRGIEIPPGLAPDHKNRCRTDNRSDNLRVLDRSSQARNQRLRCTNTSGYRSISWRQDCGKWLARITVRGNGHYLGLYPTPELAVAAYERARLDFGLLAADDAEPPPTISDDNMQIARPLMSTNTSGYRGVTWNKKRGTWQAQLQVCSKNHNLGQYSTPEEAAEAYEAARGHFRLPPIP